MKSSGAASFFIHLRYFRNVTRVKSDSLENSKTSERLVITNVNDWRYSSVTIARHPMQANAKWIEEMGKEMDSEYRIIVIESLSDI
jgi:hypothetical protein